MKALLHLLLVVFLSVTAFAAEQENELLKWGASDFLFWSSTSSGTGDLAICGDILNAKNVMPSFVSKTDVKDGKYLVIDFRSVADGLKLRGTRLQQQTLKGLVESLKKSGRSPETRSVCVSIELGAEAHLKQTVPPTKEQQDFVANRIGKMAFQGDLEPLHEVRAIYIAPISKQGYEEWWKVGVEGLEGYLLFQAPSQRAMREIGDGIRVTVVRSRGQLPSFQAEALRTALICKRHGTKVDMPTGANGKKTGKRRSKS